MPAVLWSIDTLDWKTRDAQTTIQTVLEQAKDGDIILMHDLYETTADASEVLIPELVNRGFQQIPSTVKTGNFSLHTMTRYDIISLNSKHSIGGETYEARKDFK